MSHPLHNRNFRGRSYRNQDLTGADFRGADLRGANFAHATLTGANFSNATTGITVYWGLILGLSAMVLALLSGLAIAYIGTFVGALLLNNGILVNLSFSTGLMILLLLALLFTVKLHQNLGATLPALIVTISLCVTVVAAIGNANIAISALFIALGLGVSITGTIALAVALTLAGTVAATEIIITSIFVFLLGAVAGTLLGTGVEQLTNLWGITGVMVLLALGVSFSLSQQALKGDERRGFVATVAIAFAALGGTCFRNADLTDANFTGALLQQADFKDATLTRTGWHRAQKLDKARVSHTILVDLKVLDLLVTHRGQGKSYYGADLRGANLAGADLTGADLTAADLSHATLQGACLQRSNLTKVQALGVEFNQAILTGACLEAWNIGSTTQLTGAICDHIYLLGQQRERRPISGNFAGDDFAKLFQKVLETIDLIFRHGLDWRAFALSLQQVQVQHQDTELSIESIENKGDGVVVVRVKVPPTTPEPKRSQIHRDFHQTYEPTAKALAAQYRTELQAKDREIEIYRQQNASLEGIIQTLAARPIQAQPVQLNIKTDAQSTMNQNTDQSRNVKFGNVGQDVHVRGPAFNQGDVNGTWAETIAPTSDRSPELSQLQALLLQLKTIVEAETQLKETDKADVLEQIEILEEIDHNSDPDPSQTDQQINQQIAQKPAKQAITMLKGIAASLPEATQFVEACSHLLPTIAQLFGL